METRKFGFKVRTLNGSIVEKILITAESEEEAREKLHKMYYRSEVLACWQDSGKPKASPTSFEEVVDLISRHA